MYKRLLGTAVAVSACGVLAAGAGTASAQTGNPFGCTASTAAASLAGQNLLPGATNANQARTPCATDRQTLNKTTLVNLPAAVNASVGPASAQTTLTTGTVNGAKVYTGAAATSTVDAVNLSLPGLSIALLSPSQAKVSYACVDDKLVASASSTLNAITINGQSISLNGLPKDLSIPGVATIEANDRTTSGNTTSESLLHVQLLGLIAGGLTLNVGSATVSKSGANACAGTSTTGGNGGGGNGGGGNGGGGNGGGGNGGGGNGGGNGGGGNGGGGNGGSGGNGGGGVGGTGGGTGGQGCPIGSTPSGGICKIPAGSEGNSSTITFNAGDISGGTVTSLAYARKHYKSLCLNGAGPKYAVIGNRHNNKITVKRVRERVLGLGGKDRLTVKSGKKTCVDGGTGNDAIKAAKSAVRVYGSNGNDKITVGNGKDVVYGGGGQDRIHAGNGADSLNGGGGNDTITAGNGNDHLYGNAGADKLTAGTGRDFLFGARGNDRLTARGKLAYVNGGNGHNVAYVRRANMKFARSHGCKKVHAL